jgi:nucleobase:cation symporter-1, NCS1 family
MTEFVPPQSHTAPTYTSTSTNPFVLCRSYYIVRRGNVSVPDMYNFHGMYRYSPRYASNWRAVVAFFIGCIPPLPGFVNNIVVAGNGKTSISLGGQHL